MAAARESREARAPRELRELRGAYGVRTRRPVSAPPRVARATRQPPHYSELGLTYRQYRTLLSLDTPQKIQAFLDAMPANFEHGGETVLPVAEVLRQRRSHCIEGAFLAACALWLQGERPIVMHLKAVNDYHHVITLFRRGRYWGAISKTNAVYLRYRDPIYRNFRELALSYVHEYANARGEKTLRAFSRPFDLSRVDPKKWVAADKDCWEIHDRLYYLPHTRLMSSSQVRNLRKFESFQRHIGKQLQHRKPKRRLGAKRVAHWARK